MFFMPWTSQISEGSVFTNVPQAKVPRGIQICPRDYPQKVFSTIQLHDFVTGENHFCWHWTFSNKFSCEQVEPKPQSGVHTRIRTLPDNNIDFIGFSWCNPHYCSMALSTPRSIYMLLWRRLSISLNMLPPRLWSFEQFRMYHDHHNIVSHFSKLWCCK